jgi:hypothetical protein
MSAHPNQLRQTYDVKGGTIDVKILTDHALTTEEVEGFISVIVACENYVQRWPAEAEPEQEAPPPADVAPLRPVS